MSQVTETNQSADLQQVERLCVAIRGKLQFMDYLVRAALADVERFQEEPDAGTRIFIRQLIEMHTTNLSNECDQMRVVADFCGTIDGVLNAAPTAAMGDEG